MFGAVCLGLFIVATGLLVQLKALTKKLVLLFLFSGPGFFFLSVYMVSQSEEQVTDPLTTVLVLFTVFYCLTAAWMNKRTPPEEQLTQLEILLLLACQPLVCFLCRNIVLAGGGL